MKNLFLFLLLIFRFSDLRADILFVPSEEIILKSDLVIQGKIRSSNPQYFRIEITEVYADVGRYGLKKGDYLRIANFEWRGCMEPFSILNYDTVGIALTKTENSWRVTNSQFISPFAEGKAKLVLNCPKSVFSNRRWKAEIAALFDAFDRIEDSKYCAKTDLLSFVRKHPTSGWVNYLMMMFYGSLEIEKMHEYFLCEELVSVEEMDEIIKRENENTPKEFCAVQPQELSNTRDTRDEISREILDKYGDVLIKEGLQGTIYVRFICERDSSVSNAEVLRTFYPPANDLVVNLIEAKLKMIPGSESGRKVDRCQSIIPIRIRLD